MKRASRALRDRDLLVHQRAYEAARERLTLALAEADVDALVSDRVLADLGSVEAGQNEGTSMKVKLPRKGSSPFLAYISSVRANHQALWSVKQQFVMANLRLVVTIARRFNHGRMPLQDLIQEGNIGLLKAVDRFDHRKGFRFSTYGTWWIRHAISRSIADKARAVRLPVHMIDAYNKVCRVRRDFETTHGRRPDDHEIAAATGVSIERLQRMAYSLVENPVSLDQPLSDDSGLTLLDAVEDTHNAEPAELLDNDLMVTQLREVLLATLSPMECDIVKKRMGLDDEQELTLKEIGERYSLSRERIRQLQEQALVKLRDEFRRRSLI
jgi:RNA polymerase primary sigma factor